MITESCVTKDAVFTSSDFDYALSYSTPCRFHDKNKTWICQDPLVQDFKYWLDYLNRDPSAKGMPFVRFPIRCVAVTYKSQDSLDAHNKRRSTAAHNLCSEGGSFSQRI